MNNNIKTEIKLNKYELLHILDLLIQEMSKAINSANDSLNKIGVPEFTCFLCYKNEINQSNGIKHLEKHLKYFTNKYYELKQEIIKDKKLEGNNA